MKPAAEKYLAKADECLREADALLAENLRLGAINRAYYAVFDAIQALLVENGGLVKTHQGTHRRFHEVFILTHVFPVEMAKIVKKVFEKRQVGDYDLDSNLTLEDAAESIEQARLFLETAQKWLSSK